MTVGLIEFAYDDGGRAAVGFTGSTGDCVCRSIAIALERPYREVYDALNEYAKAERLTTRAPKRSSARTGVHRKTYDRYLADAGWVFTATMGFGTGCQVHLRADELPTGRLIVRLSRHVAAVVDGVVHDTHDPSREGTRCVYGWYAKAE